MTQDGRTTFIIGDTAEQGATHARVVIAGRGPATLDVVWADLGGSRVGLYAASIDGVRIDDVTRVEMLDASGGVIAPSPTAVPSGA